MLRKLQQVLGITLLILILPGSVYLAVGGQVPAWFATLHVLAAIIFLISGTAVLIIDVVRHRRSR